MPQRKQETKIEHAVRLAEKRGFRHGHRAAMTQIMEIRRQRAVEAATIASLFPPTWECRHAEPTGSWSDPPRDWRAKTAQEAAEIHAAMIVGGGIAAKPRRVSVRRKSHTRNAPRGEKHVFLVEPRPFWRLVAVSET